MTLLYFTVRFYVYAASIYCL